MDKLDLILQELSGVKAEMAKMNERLDAIEESVDETRGAVNMLVGWAEKVTEAMSFPLPKI